MADSETIYCALCDEPVPDMELVRWTTDPWGHVYDYAHKKCADNWEPSDEQLEAQRDRGYPTLRERQAAARRLK